MSRATAAWVIGLIVILALYIGGPVFGFNRASPPILGMPPLYFWFVLVPLLNPLILGAVYLLDRHDARRDGLLDDGEI
jgi:hypothetical protein